MSDDTDSVAPQSARNTQLRGHVLLLARLIWVLVSLLLIWYCFSLLSAFTINFFTLATPASQEEGQSKYVFLATITSIVIYYLVAGIITWRRSNDWMALFASLTLMLFGSVLFSYLAYIPNPERLQWRALEGIVRGIGWACVVVFFLVFPNGSPVPRTMRWPAIIWVVYTLSWPLIPSVDPHYSSDGGFFFLLLITCFGFGAFTQFIRYEAYANVIERQQTKLTLFGFAMTALGIVIGFVLAPGMWSVGLSIMMLSFVFIPLSIGISILRYRLFDADIVIRNTLAYSILTILLGSVYTGCIVVSRIVLAPLIGNSEFAIVASTLAIAGLYLPLRRRIQAFIDKRFYRRKYDAAKVLAAFGVTVRDETDLERLTTEMLRVADDTMQAEFVSLWLCAPQKRSATEVSQSDSALQQ